MITWVAAHDAVRALVDLDHHLLRLHLGILEHLVQLVDRPAGDPRLGHGDDVLPVAGPVAGIHDDREMCVLLEDGDGVQIQGEAGRRPVESDLLRAVQRQLPLLVI